MVAIYGWGVKVDTVQSSWMKRILILIILVCNVDDSSYLAYVSNLQDKINLFIFFLDCYFSVNISVLIKSNALVMNLMSRAS